MMSGICGVLRFAAMAFAVATLLPLAAEAAEAGDPDAAADDWFYNWVRNRWQQSVEDSTPFQLVNAAAVATDTGMRFRDLHTSYMNIASREKLGFEPIMHMVNMVNDIETRDDFLRVIAEFHLRRIPCGIDAQVTQTTDGEVIIKVNIPEADESTLQDHNKYFEMVEEVLKAGKENGAFDRSMKNDWKSIIEDIRNVFDRITHHVEQKYRTPGTTEKGKLDHHLPAYSAVFGMVPSPKILISDDDLRFIGEESGVIAKQCGWDKWKHFLMWRLLESSAPFLTENMTELFRRYRKQVHGEGKLFDPFSMLTWIRCKLNEWSLKLFPTRFKAITEWLRQSMLKVAPNLGSSAAFKALQHLEYEVICSPLSSCYCSVKPDPDGHILENLWKMSIAQFTESLQSNPNGPSKYVVVGFLRQAKQHGQRDSFKTKLKAKIRRGVQSFSHKENVVEEDEFSNALMECAKKYGSEQLQFEFEVTERIASYLGRDPAQDFVNIGSVIAEWILESLETQELENVQSMPELPSSWNNLLRTKFMRNFVAFKIVHEAFGWMYGHYAIPAEVLLSQWRRFRIAAKQLYLQRFAEEPDAGDLLSQQIDSEILRSENNIAEPLPGKKSFLWK